MNSDLPAPPDAAADLVGEPWAISVPVCVLRDVSSDVHEDLARGTIDQAYVDVVPITSVSDLAVWITLRWHLQVSATARKEGVRARHLAHFIHVSEGRIGEYLKRLMKRGLIRVHGRQQNATTYTIDLDELELRSRAIAPKLVVDFGLRERENPDAMDYRVRDPLVAAELGEQGMYAAADPDRAGNDTAAMDVSQSPYRVMARTTSVPLPAFRRATWERYLGALPAPPLTLWRDCAGTILSGDTNVLVALALEHDLSTDGHGAYFVGRAILACSVDRGAKLRDVQATLRQWRLGDTYGIWEDAVVSD